MMETIGIAVCTMFAVAVFLFFTLAVLEAWENRQRGEGKPGIEVQASDPKRRMGQVSVSLAILHERQEALADEMVELFGYDAAGNAPQATTIRRACERGLHWTEIRSLIGEPKAGTYDR